MSGPKTRAERYSAGAILLHWLIAAAIVFQVVLAWRMGGPRSPEQFAVFQLHKSLGITILALSLLRLGWRLAHPPPPMPATLATWERWLARLTHLGFYAIMLGMPLTGWIMVSTSRIRVPTLLYGKIPWPDLPLAGAARGAWHEMGEVGHEALAWGVYVLLALHLAGALKHQLFSRDEPVLGRMAPGARPGRWLEPRLALILLGALVAVGAAWTIRPPPPGTAPPPAREVHDHAARDEDHATPVPLAAAPPTAVTTGPAPPEAAATAGPARWIVEAGSTLGFQTAWSGAPIEGRFERWTAEVSFSPEALDRSRVAVSIDVASAVTGDAQRDAALSAPDWFDAAAHPKARFTATRFRKTGEDRYVAQGRLSLRGVERPLSLPFRLQIDGDKARVRGVTSLDRTAFGVGQGEWTSTDQIPAKVTLSVDLRATRR